MYQWQTLLLQLLLFGEIRKLARKKQCARYICTWFGLINSGNFTEKSNCLKSYVIISVWMRMPIKVFKISTIYYFGKNYNVFLDQILSCQTIKNVTNNYKKL